MADPDVRTDPYYILLTRYGHDLRNLLLAYPDGCTDALAARALGIPEAEVRKRYDEIVLELRQEMGVEGE